MLDKLDNITQALRCCVGDGEADCHKDGVQCPYLPVPTCVPKLNKDAADAIDALRREVEQLRAKLEQETKTQPTAARQVSTKKYGAWKGGGGA